VAAAPAAADPGVGKALYEKSCVLCHGAGVAGAPKFGDKAAWAPYVATGIDTMLKVAISGKGAMPPRGASTATDDELRAAIQYMVDHAK
jgi:cytochrome c5